MAQTIINQVIRILFLVLLQSLVVNKVQLLDGLILPWIYIFGLLMLPFETPRWLTLVTAFCVGFIMDYFTGPMGLHTTACAFLGFMQPHVQKLLAPREGYEITDRPTIQRMGLPWYLTYGTMLTFVHHFVLFFLEVLRLNDFFYQLLHITLSVLATMVLMVIGQYLIFNTKPADA
jgi:cell shape-determining protein MreD